MSEEAFPKPLGLDTRKQVTGERRVYRAQPLTPGSRKRVRVRQMVSYLIEPVSLETRDHALRANGPAAVCPIKADSVQVQVIGVLPVNTMIFADIGSVRADRGIIATEFSDG